MTTPAPLRRRRLPAFLLGAGLLGAAVWAVTRHHDVAQSAWNSLRNPDPAWAFALPTAVLATLALTSVVQWVLLRRAVSSADVRLPEMTALTAASTLGNLVPMQPGLLGRIAYLHRVHEVPVAIGVLLAVQATLLTMAAAAWMALAMLLVRAGGLSWLAAPASTLLLLPAWIGPRGRMRPLGMTFLLRAAEVLLGALRCAACFALVGRPIDAGSALTLACASSLANCIPMFGNGLGVREWVTGLLAPSLAGVATPDALAAELVNRAVEVLLVVPAGLACTPTLARRLSDAMRTRRVPSRGDATTAHTSGASWSMSMGLLQRGFEASEPEPPSTPTSSER